MRKDLELRIEELAAQVLAEQTAQEEVVLFLVDPFKFLNYSHVGKAASGLYMKGMWNECERCSKEEEISIDWRPPEAQPRRIRCA